MVDDFDASWPNEHWRDRLTELHVLAQHGDAHAAATAEQWCATDRHARQLWNDVETVYRQVHL